MYVSRSSHVLLNKLDHRDLIEEKFREEEIPYKLLYMSAYSYLEKDTQIIYTILLDESDFYDRLKKLDMLMILLCCFLCTIGGTSGMILTADSCLLKVFLDVLPVTSRSDPFVFVTTNSSWR